MNTVIAFHDDLERVDWQAVADIYRSVQWGQRGGRKIIITSFTNVRYTCFAYRGGELVGFGKMMSDGVKYGAIYDVVVHRDHHHQGIGEGIMRWLLDKGADLSLITLFAVPGKEETA